MLANKPSLTSSWILLTVPISESLVTSLKIVYSLFSSSSTIFLFFLILVIIEVGRTNCLDSNLVKISILFLNDFPWSSSISKSEGKVEALLVLWTFSTSSSFHKYKW